MLAPCTLLLLAAPGVTETAEPINVTTFLQAFVSVDPEVGLADLERAIALLDVQRSSDRLRLVGEATGAGASYSHTVVAGGSFGIGAAGVTGLGTVVDDRIGGRLRARVSGQRVTDPYANVGGHTLGGEVSYDLPLWRNLLGRLYELETAALRLDVEARAAEVESARLARCTVGLELFAAAYVLQEQHAIWQELLANKKRTYERTKRDFGRRMVSALDHHTAHADWLATQQRFAAFDGQRRRSLEILATYLGTDADGMSLASPDAVFASAPAGASRGELGAQLAGHPAVRALDTAAKATVAREALVEQRWTPEVALVPAFGAEYGSHAGFTTTLSGIPTQSDMTRLYALLGLRLELPLIEPTPEIERAKLATRRDQVERRRDEVLRALRERVSTSTQDLAAVDARIALTDEKLATIEKQIREASTLYQNGRLEFQDYLQHWAFYENARFERLELQLARWQSLVHMLSALGPLPAACEGE